MKQFCFALIAIAGLSSLANAAALDKAEQLLSSGQADAALLEVEAFLASNPNNPDAKFLQGISLARVGKTKDAIKVFENLTKNFPDIAEPYNNLAVLRAQNGDYLGARDALEDAVEKHPGYTTAWENLADIYSALTTIAYEAVVTQDPNNTRAKQRLSALAGIPVAASSQVASKGQKPNTKPAVVAAADPLASVPLLPMGNSSAAKPAPAKVSTPPATARVEVPASVKPGTDKEQIVSNINLWAQSWASGDVNNYLGAYSENFQPNDGKSLKQWQQTRRSRLAGSKGIRIQVSDLSVNFLSEDLAMAKFTQDYQSKTYQDRVTKTLLLERNRGQWVIVREQSN